MKLSVVVATLGRREEAQDLVGNLLAQTRPADRVVFAVVNPDDAPDCEGHDGFDVLMCERRGSCAQRNIGIDHVSDDTDILVFLDDDIVLSTTYLERLEQRFLAEPDVVGVTGLVVADGITGPGLSLEEAQQAIRDQEQARPEGEAVIDSRLGLYGCNMAVRFSAMGDQRFDEAMPLYGWLEDLDLSTQLSQQGRLIRDRRLVSAHRGVKRGRTSGVKLGYSQIANPIYLMQKGNVPKRPMFENMVFNFGANLLKSVRPETYVDRRGRLKGNLLGLADAVRRKSSPGRILEL